MPLKKSTNKVSSKASNKGSDKVINHDSDTESDDSNNDSKTLKKSTNKGSQKVSDKVIDHDSETDSDNDSKTLKKKATSPKIKAKPVEDDSEDSDESSDDEQNLKVKSTNLKTETIEDDSEDIDNDSEVDNVSESDETQDKKLKDKKSKETFDELLKKLDIVQFNIKLIDKEISETNKNLKIKEKSRYDNERQRNSILKLLPKTHNDEVTKARKQKTKRNKGNAEGGFCSLQPVPEILIKFLDLKEDERCLRRPQVTSRLSNKFSTMGLKNGQVTTLNEKVVKELGLDDSYVGREINFGGFQTFLKGFYQVKEDKNKNIVNVA